MATDYKAELEASVWTALRANATVAATFKLGNQFDERTDGPSRQRLANRMPVDAPNIAVEITGGDEAQTRTPHFGLTGTVQVCDAIIPVSVLLRVTMRFDKEKLGDQTPAETAVRQALHQGYPKLGLSYVRDFTIRERRTPPAKVQGGITEVVWDVTVTLRLHLSQLRD